MPRSSIPNILAAAIVVAAAVGLGSCADVSANYPPQTAEAPPELPETYHGHDGEKRMIWNEEGAVRAFHYKSELTQETVERWRELASGGNHAFDDQRRLLDRPARAGLGHSLLVVFMSRETERRLETGDLTITFDDGASIQDRGLVMAPFPGTAVRTASSFQGPLTIRGADDPEMQGRKLYVFYPAEYLGRTVRSISMRGDGER